jgi:hypothetical protein
VVVCFQALEKLQGDFPGPGKKSAGFSKPWKNPRQNFPMPGKSGAPLSNPWKP